MASPGRLLLQVNKETPRASLLARQCLRAVIQSQMTSHHSCHIVLVRSQSQALSTLKGRGLHKSKTPGGGDHSGSPWGLSITHIKTSSQMYLSQIYFEKNKNKNSSEFCFYLLYLYLNAVFIHINKLYLDDPKCFSCYFIVETASSFHLRMFRIKAMSYNDFYVFFR